MRVDREPSYVLHGRAYRDTSLILDCFSVNYGRVGLIARGARGPKSRQAGLLQPFSPTLLSWAGRGELPSLRSVESDGPAVPFGGDRLICGLYVNELLVRLTARFDPHPGLYAHYRQLLQELAHTAVDSIQPVLRLFEKRLLEEIGYGLVLTHATDSGAPLNADLRYCYLPDQGPVADTNQSAGTLISGRSLLALAVDKIGDDDEVLRELKRLTRAMIDLQLGGKPLKTRELMRVRQRRAAD